MGVPDSLQRCIDAALVAIRADPVHDLGVGYRQAIYAAFGPRATNPKDSRTIGHTRRTILAIRTVRQVLPIWEQTQPQDNSPQYLLMAAEQMLQGHPVDWELVGHARFSSFDVVRRADFVGLAATLALGVAQWDSDFNPAWVNTALTDVQLEGHLHDTAFFAAVAYTGSSPWAPDASAKRWYSFWQWWLAEAVPASWDAVISPQVGKIAP